MPHITDAIEGEAWIPDPPEGNHEDSFADAFLADVELPLEVSHLEHMPPVANQSRGGACVLFAMMCAIYARQSMGDGLHAPTPPEDLEPMGIPRPWWLCRDEADSAHLNTGTNNRRAGRILTQKGFSRQRHDRYRWANYAMPPDPALDRLCADQAAVNAVRSRPGDPPRAPLMIARLPKRSDENRHRAVLKAIAAGCVVVAGWTIPERLKHDDEVDWTKPFAIEDGEEMGGGHAMAMYAYDRHGNVDTQNSWGSDNHQGGRFVAAPSFVEACRDAIIVLSCPSFSDTIPG